MALQRVRLQSFAPLPSFRVWFLVPQNAVDVQLLKLAISSLPALKGLDILPTQLALEMDGFELLDESSIDLIREGDIIVVKTREPAVLDKLESKANVAKAMTAPKRHRSSVSSTDSSRESSSSTSDSSTSDPSTSGSGTPFSSGDSESEDSKSVPGPKMLFTPFNNKAQSKSISPVVGIRAACPVRSCIQQPTVPPGLGKPSTHSRNKRRKLKRKYAAAQSSSQTKNLILPAGVNGDQISPVGIDRQPASVSITRHSVIQYNHNYDGSMQAVKDTAPLRLDSNSSVPTISGYATTFIPPSEREDLPKNLFVTGVELNWRTSQARTAGQNASKLESWARPDETHAMQLFDPGLHHPSDWAAIETAWEGYKTLDASIELLPDTIVAWKAFGLDPVTLTPQASMLHLGKVVSVDGGNVLVQPLARPNIGPAAFGRSSMREDGEPANQISHPLQKVWSDEWKLITHQ